MKIGVDYYPEHWDKSMWKQDADLMARTGVKLVRIAEFSWAKLEPREGEYDFEWLDEMIGIFADRSIGVVLCVPTNCPPVWLYKEHPEIVRKGTDGNRIQTGIRGHRCINSAVFMDYAKNITQQLAVRYANNPAITAWQIDNELEAYSCTCDECKEKFRDWLIDKYNDIDTINTAYGTDVWSAVYSDISDVEPPNAYPMEWQNPSLCLDWHRFTSYSVTEYVRSLVYEIRKENQKVPVTTNTFFCEDRPDYYELFDKLDFVSYDNYPPTRLPENKDDYYSHAFHLDFMRGIKGEKFWVMEQLSGITGCWAPMSTAPKPGMIMGYSLQAVAHGADSVLHFRWRSAVKGAEMFCHGLIDHSNVPGRRFSEFEELCKNVSKLGVIDTTRIVSDIAIIYTSDNDFALRNQPQSDNFSYMKQLREYHAAFTRLGANVDIVPPTADLSIYKLVIAPSMFVYKKAEVENIYRYVINGGTVVLTSRSGVKDSNNNCIMQPLPTVYRDLIGAEITEYDPVGYEKRLIRDFAGNEFECHTWCDILQLTSARAYAEYDDGYYRCCPAVTMNRYCSGVAYYVGTECNSDFYEDFASNLMKQTGIPRLKGLPAGIEVTTRTNGLDEYIFFFNNSEETAEINLPKPMYSLLSSVGKETLELRPFEMEVVRK